MLKQGASSGALLILLMALIMSLSGCPASEPQGPKALVVAMDPRIGAPYVYEPDAKQYGGFEVEVCRYLASKLGRPLEIRPVRWPQLAETVRRRQADLALNAIEKPAKEPAPAELAYTEHYYTAYQQLAVRKSDKFTYNLSDLKGKKVGVVEGSVAQLLLNELNQLKQAKIAIAPYPTPAAAFADLGAGKLQATLTERAFAGWFSREGKIRLAGDRITGELPYVGLVRADQPELLKQLNATLVAARKDPAFSKIFDKWHVSIKR